MQDRAGDVVRQVGDDVVGRLDEVDEVLVERVALDRAGGGRRAPVEPLAQERRQAAVELDRGDRGAGVEQPAGQQPEPGPISRTRRPGAGSASARIASRTSVSARKFCDSAWRARRPAARSVRPDRRRVDAWRRRPRRSPGGQRQRRPGVEVEPGPLAGGEPARAGRPDHRPVVGAQAGPRHDERQPERLRLAGQPRPQGARSPPRRRPARSSGRRSPAAARIVLVASTSTTASWKPQASSATTASGSGASGVVGQARVGPRLGRRSGAPRS